MEQLLTRPYIKSSLLISYTLLMGYFLGRMLIWVLPNVLNLKWPLSLIPGYLLGIILGVGIIYLLYKKWQAPSKKKIIIAALLLVGVSILSIAVVQWMSYLLRLRAIELLG